MISRRGRSVYFYRYERAGGRTRRVYAAKGEAALQEQARLDEARRPLQEERERARLADQRHAQATAPLSRLSELIDALVRMALEARGFKRHARGEWRLTRR